MAKHYTAVLMITESGEDAAPKGTLRRVEQDAERHIQKNPTEVAKIVVRAETLTALNRKLRLHVGILADDDDANVVELKELTKNQREAERRGY